jgi:cell division septum initiation protein DivIVA
LKNKEKIVSSVHGVLSNLKKTLQRAAMMKSFSPTNRNVAKREILNQSHSPPRRRLTSSIHAAAATMSQTTIAESLRKLSDRIHSSLEKHRRHGHQLQRDRDRLQKWVEEF